MTTSRVFLYPVGPVKDHRITSIADLYDSDMPLSEYLTLCIRHLFQSSGHGIGELRVLTGPSELFLRIHEDALRSSVFDDAVLYPIGPSEWFADTHICSTIMAMCGRLVRPVYTGAHSFYASRTSPTRHSYSVVNFEYCQVKHRPNAVEEATNSQLLLPKQ